MNKKVLAVILVMALLLCPAAEAFAEAPADIGTRIEAYVAAHEETTAGLAVSVFDTGGVVYQNNFGYADRENGVPVTAETVFEWGSATKLLVWVSVMQLREQGKLDLDADVRTYLPEGFLTNLHYDTPVTLTHLMNHTAGFQELLVDLFLPQGSALPTLENALRAHEPAQIYEPGTVTAYSNWGTALAGYIVERVSGESFCDYVHAHIFAPLGMGHSALAPDLSDNEWVRMRRQELSCYTAAGTLIPNCFYHITLYPAGMCTGTLSDFTAFAMALLDTDCPLFASADTRDELFSPTARYDDGLARNCHGFWVLPFGVETVGHGGNTAGCSSYLLLDLKGGTGVTLMTNQSGETVYNEGLPALVFGDYRADETRALPQGVYRAARTVLRGPLKLYSVGYTFFTQEDEGAFWVASAGRVSFPYGDLLKISAGRMLLELGLLLLWGLGILFSLGYLLISSIRFLWRRRNDPQPPDAKRPYRRVGALLQLVTGLLLAVLVVFVSSYRATSSYSWLLVLPGLLAAAMTAIFCLLLKKRTAPQRRGVTALNVLSLVFLAAAVANVLYWQLYMFWAL